MTDLEFEILDELYFPVDFDYLQKNLSLNETELKTELGKLLEKGWVKMLEKQTDLESEGLELFDKNFKKYNYLATKAGLLAHNSR
jgi:hypothetical protein